MHARLWLFAGLLTLGSLSPLGAQQPWAMPPTGGQYGAPAAYWPSAPGAAPYAMPGNYGYQAAGYMPPQGYAMAPQGYSMAPQGYPGSGYPMDAGGQVQLVQATAPVTDEAIPEGATPEGATNTVDDGTVYIGPDGQIIPSDGYEQPAVPGYGHAPVFGWQPPPTGTRLRNLLPGPYQGLGAQDGCGPGLFGDKLVSRLGHIYVKADSLMWRRNNPGGNVTLVQPASAADPTVAGSPLVTTGSFQMKNEVGQRITLGISQSERSNIEVTYWSFQNSLATTGAVQAGNLFIGGPNNSTALPPPLGPVGFSSFADANSIQAAYSTTIWNAEVNYLATSVFDKFVFLGGFRTIQLHDHLSMLSQTTSLGPGLFDLPIRNEMYGGQIGFIFRQNIDLLTFEITSKSGCYNNHANMQSYVAGFTSGVIRDMGSSSNAAAFVQEFSANLTYHFTSAFAIRLGYQVMWFDNMALAANNVDLNLAATPVINRGQNLFLYGANLGLEARF